MRRVKGLTLIKLLVVIAIISLSVAILMPVLSRVHKHARMMAYRNAVEVEVRSQHHKT